MCCRSTGILSTSCGWWCSPRCISSEGKLNRWSNEQPASGYDMALEQDMNPQRTSTLASVELPAPTAWPIALAFGVALLFAGLVTSPAVSALGAILTVAGCVGWCCRVLPHEPDETVAVVTAAPPVVTDCREAGS